MKTHNSVITEIENKIVEHIEDWEPGKSDLEIPIEVLELGSFNLYEVVDRFLGHFEVIEGAYYLMGDLVIVIDSNVLESAYAIRRDEWSREKELEKQEFYNSRGVI